MNATTYELGPLTFPEPGEAAKDWQPQVMRHALACDIMIVAQSRIEGAWKAYVAVVSGYDHNQESGAVLATGTPMMEEHARAFFPYLEDVPYAH